MGEGASEGAERSAALCCSRNREHTNRRR